MRTSPNELPWKNAPDAVACNFAIGHLVENLPRRLTVDGRIHAETYISAVGAIAGYAAQRTLFAESPPVMGVNINLVGVASGEQYWFGDTLNYMLVPKTEAEGSRCVWSLAAGGALNAGIQPQQMPKLDAMFKHVASTIGEANEGKSSVPAQHQAHLPARDLLKAVWPVAIMCFSMDMIIRTPLRQRECYRGRRTSRESWAARLTGASGEAYVARKVERWWTHDGLRSDHPSCLITGPRFATSERPVLEFMVAQPGQTCSGHVGLDTVFEGVEADALTFQMFRQLLWRNPHSRAHLREGSIDLRVCQTETRFLSLLDLVHVVGQLADHILSSGLLVCLGGLAIGHITADSR